jgi:hypothetical protein
MFLFVSGIMVGLRIESREDRGWGPRKRMFDVLKRAGYVLAAGVLILFLQWAARWRWSNFGYMLQIGILNCIAPAIRRLRARGRRSVLLRPALHAVPESRLLGEQPGPDRAGSGSGPCVGAGRIFDRALLLAIDRQDGIGRTGEGCNRPHFRAPLMQRALPGPALGAALVIE